MYAEARAVWWTGKENPAALNSNFSRKVVNKMFVLQLNIQKLLPVIRKQCSERKCGNMLDAFDKIISVLGQEI